MPKKKLNAVEILRQIRAESEHEFISAKAVNTLKGWPDFIDKVLTSLDNQSPPGVKHFNLYVECLTRQLSKIAIAVRQSLDNNDTGLLQDSIMAMHSIVSKIKTLVENYCVDCTKKVRPFSSKELKILNKANNEWNAHCEVLRVLVSKNPSDVIIIRKSQFNKCKSLKLLEKIIQNPDHHIRDRGGRAYKTLRETLIEKGFGKVAESLTRNDGIIKLSAACKIELIAK
jgi:hypothetical protein